MLEIAECVTSLVHILSCRKPNFGVSCEPVHCSGMQDKHNFHAFYDKW